MHLDARGKFIRTDVWREGAWLDLWSVVHVLSGITLGFIPKYIGLDMMSAYVIVFLLLVLYEMFEALVKIEETRANRFMDVVVGMASFAPTYHIHQTVGEPFGMWLFMGFFAAASILGAVGWRASQKAAVFEKKLRAELTSGRERLRERREAFSERMQERRERRRRPRMNPRHHG